MTDRTLVNRNAQNSMLLKLFSDSHLLSENVRTRDAALLLLDECLRYDPTVVTVDIVQICINDILMQSPCRLYLRDDRLECGTEASLGYPDTEGWGSLETSLKALTMCFSYISNFEIISLAFPILDQLVRHSNRFAREHVQFLLHEVVRNCPLPFDDIIIGYLADGLEDNWSQVRYATGSAVRCLVRRIIASNDYQPILNRIVPLLLLNRHFVAEGIKRQSQDTWRILVGSSGGFRLIQQSFNRIIEQLTISIESINHSTRESASSCMYEILKRILVTPENRLLLHSALTSVIRVVIASLEDEAWSVREFGHEAAGILYANGSEGMSDIDSKLLKDQAEFVAALIFNDISHHVQPIRVSAGTALAKVAAHSLSDAWLDRLMCFIESNIDACCTEINQGIVAGQSFKRITEDQCCENRPMYSCGSLVSNSAIKNLHAHSMSDDCCASGTLRTDGKPKSWELSDGCIRLYAAMVKVPAVRMKLNENRILLCTNKLAQISRNTNFVKAIEIHELISDFFPLTFGA